MRTINIEPDWPNVTRWMAHVLSEHGFERFALSPVISFMEQVRYLAVKDPEELAKIIQELQAKQQVRGEA